MGDVAPSGVQATWSWTENELLTTGVLMSADPMYLVLIGHSPSKLLRWGDL